MRLFFAIFLIIGSCDFSAAEVVKTVRATGVGLIIDGDLNGGFEQARKAAMRQAVEEGVGVLVTSQTRVHNFAVIEDDILTRTEGYIRSLEVVEHGPVDEHTYQVTIDAVVGLGDLRQRLDGLELLIESAGNPLILCLGRERLREDNILREAGWGSVARYLEQNLRKASQGFHLVDSPGLDRQKGLADLQTAARIGRQQGGDVVVRGEAVVQQAKGIRIPNTGTSLERMGIHSVTVELQVEALWTDSGEIFAVVSTSQRAAGTTFQAAAEKAIRSGVEKLTGELLDELTEDWREKVYSGRLIRLLVQGSDAQLRSFERELPLRVDTVEKLTPRSYTAGSGVYDIRAKGSGFEVARRLAARGLGEGLHLDILQVTPNTLKLSLEPEIGTDDSDRTDHTP